MDFRQSWYYRLVILLWQNHVGGCHFVIWYSKLQWGHYGEYPVNIWVFFVLFWLYMYHWFLVDSFHFLIHIFQVCFSGTGKMAWLPQDQSSNPKVYSSNRSGERFFHRNSNSIEILFHSHLDSKYSNRNKILYMAWQLCCRGMCKKFLRSNGQQRNYSMANFPLNLNCGQKIVSETGPSFES